jgi:thiol-disulfide isomerase/thioredoxin
VSNFEFLLPKGMQYIFWDYFTIYAFRDLRWESILASMYRFLLLLLFPFSLFAGPGDPVSDFTLEGLQDSVTLSQFRGKVVYLDFWASWCLPCRESFPWMNRMTSRYRRDGLVVIAVNLDKDRALADKFLKALKPDFTIAFDPKAEVAERYDVQMMPSSYLIDREGRISTQHRGFFANQAKNIETEIRGLLRNGGNKG